MENYFFIMTSIICKIVPINFHQLTNSDVNESYTFHKDFAEGLKN
jgi:hypothetical protein